MGKDVEEYRPDLI